MIAAKLDLDIDAGTDFSQSFTLQDPTTNLPIDMTGYTGASQIRANYSAPKPLVTFTVTNDGAGGTWTFSCAAVDTENLPFHTPTGLKDCPVEAVWDLFITDTGGKETRLLRGIARIYPRVTQ